MSWNNLAVQIQDMHKRVALMQSQHKKQQALENIELVTAVFQELNLALEELQIANEELRQQNEELFNTQEALLIQYQRYQQLFEEAPDAYLVTDTKGVIKEVNSAATTLFNISKSFLVGELLEAYVVEKELIAFHLRLNELRDRAQIQEWQTQEWEVSLRPRNRIPIIVSLKVAAIWNQQSQLVGLRWLLRDITKNKHVEAKLRWAEEAMRQALFKERELSELKSRLLNITSHEFRTPLATILYSAELLEHYRDELSDERQLTYLHQIQESVSQIDQLLNDVLVLNQDEVSKLEINPAPLNLVEFCRNFLEELEQEERSRVAIFFSSEYPCIQANLDTRLLRHILSNLFSNCLKYSPLLSTVKFSIAAVNDQAKFQIRDSGIGIPLSEIENIFEPFYRASNVANIPGMGLGLSIVKKAVDLHGGQITVESSLEAGTIFTVILPFLGNLYI